MHPFGLTDHEFQAIQLVAEGRTSKEIGRLLGMAEDGADKVVCRAMRSLGARNRAQMVFIAGRRGLLSDLS